jgi:uncharacterized oxidoreductase
MIFLLVCTFLNDDNQNTFDWHEKNVSSIKSLKMNTTNNTVLITGGGSGIGFEIAKLFSEKGNQVIITGRNEKRLQKAASKLKNVNIIVSDVINGQDVNLLVATIEKDYPALNIVVNNAGKAIVYNLAEENINGADKSMEEMTTNYFAVIRLTEKLLPLLKKQPVSAIVNVSSIGAFVPSHVLPTYSASKAALHSYTQALRVTLDKSTSVKVFELMPPLVDTEFSTEIGGSNGIQPSVVAADLLKAMETETYQIHVGATANLYQLFRSSPGEALKIMNPDHSVVNV